MYARLTGFYGHPRRIAPNAAFASRVAVSHLVARVERSAGDPEGAARPRRSLALVPRGPSGPPFMIKPRQRLSAPSIIGPEGRLISQSAQVGPPEWLRVASLLSGRSATHPRGLPARQAAPLGGAPLDHRRGEKNNELNQYFIGGGSPIADGTG